MSEDALPEEPEMTAAAWQIERFVWRFRGAGSVQSATQSDYRLLAQYASLPLVLTPELLNYLRDRFLPKVPWIAEADLLLSDLCRSVGYEQYVLLPAVRAILFQELKQRHPEALSAVAKKVLSYTQYWARTNSYFTPWEKRRQEWSAMQFIVEEHANLLGQIFDTFAAIDSQLASATTNTLVRQEMARVTRLILELDPNYFQHPFIFDYAQYVTQIANRSLEIDPQVLRQSFGYGGRELPKLEKLLPPLPPPTELFPDLTPFNFEVAEFVELDRSVLPRVPHSFKVATIVVQEARNLLGRTAAPKIVIKRQAKEDWQYVETLAAPLTLELVKIPAGRFMMGALQQEADSNDNERPQHWVEVPEFYLGKYTVTQAQWRFGAGLPQVERELNPNPSGFKGNDLPVEGVSWFDAQEFCARLSVYTGRAYRLPSEAEWEYACRAADNQQGAAPFHFGETIDPRVANYDGGYTYGRGCKGRYRGKTTPVGFFKVANDYGLYDMHGNVWEWCQDHWHNSYRGAPSDGSAWVHAEASEEASRMLRGGSWNHDPSLCRAAMRFNHAAVSQGGIVGLRLVLAARTL